jgi:lipid II:glycine glycyltransferase (peptidoglycan interpeptide bridge formation enzyme)
MTQWDEFVQSHPDGTPYHLSCWLRTIDETYSFTPFMYVVKKDDGSIDGIFPLFRIKSLISGSRLVSLPFSDYGGPLFLDQEEETELLKRIIHKHGKSVKYIEIRSKLAQGSDFMAYNYYKRHVLDMSLGLSDIRKKIDKRTIQYSIRKAEKKGVKITEENTPSGMNEFYRLNMLTRKKHGVPCQPKKFFDNILKNVISKGHGFILLAFYDSKCVASSLFLKCNNTIHYKYNASDPDYMKKVSPNHSLTYQALRTGCERGFTSFDYGRTSPDNHGLIRYKKMWGSKMSDIPYYYYPKIKGASSTRESSWIYRRLTYIWKLLPAQVIEKLGPMIHKHMA